ncbi:hypothetical protein BN971_03860 [Mycobacterium bohemicum DSM 44277]|uniref:Uncharacterized protein n=2 Tax=Mycobacterium bohemicum TaxID=56425 RepID=A0A1X1R6D2_MYCBE|nr:hypothetical protein [Mycobacterium bohemicum]MCV6970885.1 hypothetical protein [Mycobacterium bohemicum]ORV00286.1 hypothetical protein AWB93_10800 [Mycobacterium bohemicum]CPR12561.1 hypothetical protein BN971_03860 [Mycobacterium bohemicum DSM 44277]
MSWGAGKDRRRQAAVAIVAAIGVFIALVAGSSLRPQFAAAALPEPAAWTQNAPEPAVNAAQPQAHPLAQSTSVDKEGFSPRPAAPGKKPFHSMWMTRQVPASWTRLPALAPWPPVSASPNAVRPIGHRCDAPAATGFVDISVTRLCIARC